jgi:hypothetical protein
MLPTGLLLSDLSDRAIRVWAILDELARSSPSTDITLAALVTVSGASRRNLSRALAELLTAGWLDRVAGNGRASTYVPLRRPRPIGRPVDDDVDNPGGDLGHLRPGFAAKLGHIRPGLPAPTLCTARGGRREEPTPSARPVDNVADGGAARRPAWCGRCDEATRQLEVADHVERCPACHPLRVPRF